MPCVEELDVPPNPFPLATPSSLGPMDPSHFAQPSHDSAPEATGHVQLAQHSLYYELRGLQHAQKVLLLNPLACTAKFYGGLADAISTQHMVLTFDYRGTGHSTCPRGRDWTSQLMAADAMGLLDKVWPEEPVHVAGISMGGFIAQKLGVILVQQGRLASLCLLVTSASYLPHLHMPLFMYDITCSFLFGGPPRKVLERSRKSQNLFLKLFAPGVEKRPATGPDGKESTMGKLWVDKWLAESKEWFTIDDHKCCAGQLRLCVRHKSTRRELTVLRDSHVAITVYVAMKDKTVLRSAQEKMARKLGAVMYRAKARHLGVVDDFDNLVNLLLITINGASEPDSLQQLLDKEDLTPKAHNRT